jgi:hypothetical protein
MNVIILGTPADAHAKAVAREIETRGSQVQFLDFVEFPSKVQLSLIPSNPESGNEQIPSGMVRFKNGAKWNWTDIQAVYWRSFQLPQVTGVPDPEQQYIASNDSRSLIESLLWKLQARWVNGIQAYEFHQRKPSQLALTASLGVKIPQTIITNDPQAVRAFADRIPNAIFKPVQGGAHTEILQSQHLTDENLRNLTFSPIALQEEIAGTDIRVFVAGKRTLACEIRSAATDFRDDASPEIVPIEIPPEIERTSRRIASAFHLLWTGIDFRRTPTGEYVFFEANPSPMFLGFQSRTGLPLLESLVDVLLDESYSPWRESEDIRRPKLNSP